MFNFIYTIRYRTVHIDIQLYISYRTIPSIPFQVDRLASELQLTPLEAWQHLHRLVENVNALTATLVNRKFGDRHHILWVYSLDYFPKLFVRRGLHTVVADLVFFVGFQQNSLAWFCFLSLPNAPPKALGAVPSKVLYPYSINLYCMFCVVQIGAGILKSKTLNPARITLFNPNGNPFHILDDTIRSCLIPFVPGIWSTLVFTI